MTGRPLGRGTHETLARLSKKPPRRVGANALSNLTGYAFLTLIALVCTPLFIRIIGEARYGVLALIWLLFGYFGIFDFGLSRATANRLAKTKDASPAERAKVFWTALLSNLALGVLGALIFFLVSKQLLSYYIKIPDALSSEIDRGLPFIALLIPLATVNGVFAATLEASEQFFKLNVLQVIGSAIFQVLPLAAVILLEPRVDIAIIASAIGRAAAVLLTASAALQIVGFSHALRPDGHIAGQLFRYGGWVAVFSVMAPLIVTIDQFIIGATIGVQAVAYYSVAYSVAGRANIIPLSLSRALFPRLSRHTREQAQTMATNALALLASTTAGMYAAAIFLSRPALEIWIGKDFAANAAPVMEIMFVGIWLNGLAYVPFSMTQAQGRPDLVAKISLLEFLPYLATLLLLISSFGLRGAAVAAALRSGVDAAIQYKAAGLRLEGLGKLAGSLALLLGVLAIVQMNSIGTVMALCFAAAGLALSAFQMMRHPTLRSYAANMIKSTR